MWGGEDDVRVFERFWVVKRPAVDIGNAFVEVYRRSLDAVPESKPPGKVQVVRAVTPAQTEPQRYLYENGCPGRWIQ